MVFLWQRKTKKSHASRAFDALSHLRYTFSAAS